MIGDRLKFERVRLGLSQTAFGEIAGAAKRTVIDWEKGATSPTAVQLSALVKHGLRVAYVLTGEVCAEDELPDAPLAQEIVDSYTAGRKETADDQEYVSVPLYDVRASAGHGVAVHSEQIVNHLAFRHDWLRAQFGVSRPDIALIEVYGDSMSPTLSNGDLVLIDTRVERVVGSSVYVLQHDGHLLVKRIQQMMDGSLVIKSDNPAYSPETVPAEQAGDVRVVGRVVWSGRRM